MIDFAYHMASRIVVEHHRAACHYTEYSETARGENVHPVHPWSFRYLILVPGASIQYSGTPSTPQSEGFNEPIIRLCCCTVQL